MANPSARQLFCPQCRTYAANWFACPYCQRLRGPEVLPEPGQPLWMAELGGRISGRVARWQEILFAGVNPGGLALVHLGVVQKWRERARQTTLSLPLNSKAVYLMPLGDEQAGVKSSPVVADDQLIVAATDGRVYCLALPDCRILWKTPALGATLRSTPMVDGERVYVPAGGQVFCLHRNTGREVWSFHTFGRKLSDVSLHEKSDLLLVGDEQGRLYAVNSITGRAVWSRPLMLTPTGHTKPLWKRLLAPSGPPSEARPIRATPRVLDNLAYVGAGDRVYAIDLRQRQIKWRFVTGGTVRASPMPVGNRVFVASKDHHIYALDIETGKEVWPHAHRRDHSLVSDLVCVDGILYLGANEGAILALDSETGQAIWTYPTPDRREVFSSPLVDEGVVYSGSEEGRLLALPWHLGEYIRLAPWLSVKSRPAEAALLWAAAADREKNASQRLAYRAQAIESLSRAGMPEFIGPMWEAEGQPTRAANAYEQAAEAIRLADPEQAAACYLRAGELWKQLRWEKQEAEEQVAEAGYARCQQQLQHLPHIRLPHLSAKPIQVPDFLQQVSARFTLDLCNTGKAVANEIRVRVSGGVAEIQDYIFKGNLAPESESQITFEIRPTKRDDQLMVDIYYRDAHRKHSPFHTRLPAIPIHASTSTVIQAQDIASLKLVNITGPLIVDADMIGSLHVTMQTTTCPHCGIGLATDATYCTNCGRKVL